MKITKLTISNVLRLTAVEINPAGGLVVIGGENGQGKSSVLNSIAMSLGGGAEISAVPIHRGEHKGHVITEIGEDDGIKRPTDLIVTRAFSENGPARLEIKTRDAAVKTSPQGLLDKLTGKLAFDPLAFTKLEPKDQRATLVRIVGLDFTKLDADRKTAFEQRTGKNSEVKSAEARLASQPVCVGAPAAEVSTAELLKELTAAQTHNQQKSVRDRAVTDADHAVSERTRTIKEIRDEMERLQAKLTQFQGYLATEQEAAKTARAHAAAFTPVDETPIRARITGASEANKQVQQNAARRQTQDELSARRKEADDLTHKIEAIDAQKAGALAAAKFPVPGLAFDEQGVTFNGLPFGQSSGAEQIRVSVAIAAALNPKLRVILVRDGSLMDEKSLALLGSLAAQYQLQVWVERVGAGKECSVIIEDGSVSEVRDYRPEPMPTPPFAKAEPAAFALAGEDDL